ncbi:MAG TPA: toll/interleukin-1 receptor domain-containing protein, partial [Rubrivivax sp.]|nr:toll/interleukin-1 receptor domain-containing protein [Rubrivivax sp.]
MGGSERVFISYRRDDAAGYAGRLEEALEQRLGRGSVFRDVIDIAPGADFEQAIRQRLAGAQAVLVLIGPRWAGSDASGSRRLGDARIEHAQIAVGHRR